MKGVDDIEGWYRYELNNYSVEPDKNLWNSLSEDLDASRELTDETVGEWYKKEVSKLEERPDYTVWEKLATKLDTNSVWGKLSVSLDRYDQFVWWRNVVIRGVAVFLLFFTSYLVYNSYTANKGQMAKQKYTSGNNKLKKQNTKTSITPQNDFFSTYEAAFIGGNKNQSSKTKKDILTTEEKIVTTAQEAKKVVNPTKYNKRNGRKQNTSYASIKKIQEYYSSIYKDRLEGLKSEKEKGINVNINRKRLSEKDISSMYVDGEYLVKKDKDKIVFNSKRFSSFSMFGIYTRRIYAGINVGVKKQGMITALKKDSRISGYQQNVLLDFGSSFGGAVGLIVSDNLNVETNININSTSGYKRAFSVEGVSYQENLNLNYTSVSILAKKMNNKSTFDNKVYSTNLIGGVYASYLRTAISDVGGVSQKLDEYSKTDMGIVLGVEQDRYITKTLVVTPGIRYNQGLTNNVNDSSPFKSSRNFSFEFNLGVKYIFLKKGK